MKTMQINDTKYYIVDTNSQKKNTKSKQKHKKLKTQIITEKNIKIEKFITYKIYSLE